MRGTPAFEYELPHRQPGRFGSSRLGKSMEWTTTTWLRFNLFVCWLVVLSMIAGGVITGRPVLSTLLFSPLAGLVMLAAIQVAGWIGAFIPGLSVVFGLFRLLYVWAFCRLIVQPAPRVHMPLWFARH